MARPPRTRPTMAMARSTMRSEIAPDSMSAPARMKSGMARRTKESTPPRSLMGRMVRLTPPIPMRYVAEVRARVKARGRPRAAVTRKPMTRTRSGVAPATRGTSTDATTRPAVPSDHARGALLGPAAELRNERERTSARAPPAASAERAAPEMPLAGSRSAALETVRRQAGAARQRKNTRSTIRRPRSTAARCRGASSRTSAVTRGCSDSCSARMPPTHMSHTSSSRAISSVQGRGLRSRWRPTT